MPILEVDGVNLETHQSNAIARYLAHQHGLAGHSKWEETRADMIVDSMCYLHAGMLSYYKYIFLRSLIK